MITLQLILLFDIVGIVFIALLIDHMCASFTLHRRCDRERPVGQVQEGDMVMYFSNKLMFAQVAKAKYHDGKLTLHQAGKTDWGGYSFDIRECVDDVQVLARYRTLFTRLSGT